MRYHDDSGEAELCIQPICNQKPDFSCSNLCRFNFTSYTVGFQYEFLKNSWILEVHEFKMTAS